MGAREHERNMKGTCVNKSNTKCFGNESESLRSKGDPIPVDKNQTLITIEQNMGKQGGEGGAISMSLRLA